jgi:hypothetical protein
MGIDEGGAVEDAGVGAPDGRPEQFLFFGGVPLLSKEVTPMEESGGY